MRPWRCTALLPVLWLAGCASLGQTEADVYKRESGGKLAYWMPVQQAAAAHWPYAWAALAAYQNEYDRKRKPLEVSRECPEPHDYLESRQWVLWDTLPLLRHGDADMRPAAAAMRATHLRAEVWSNAAERKVIVAFGGTVFTSLQDWKSNFRWLLDPLGSVDAYDVLTEHFVPAFRNEYRRRSGESGNAWLKTAELVAAGHSLGGGLAQRFAYSLAPAADMPRVRTVFAFDPSPVSGKRGVDHEETAEGLTIYRIYNRGEVLAGLRSILKWGNPADRRNQGQRWVDVRYRSKWTWRTLLPSGSVRAHSMQDLACFIKDKLPAPQ